MPIPLDGFSGKRLYAISPATRFAAKLSTGGPYRPLPTRLNIYTKTVSTFVFSKVPRVFSKVLTVFTKVLTVLTGVPGGFQQYHTFTAGGATVLSRSRNHAGQTARAI